ncbi:hypothetical protein HMP06_1423 [Sphingomonas sp. HMP6]|nr:hypothetical protein HMP06_1423 [Sphingomonas sp. HMP6]
MLLPDLRARRGLLTPATATKHAETATEEEDHGQQHRDPAAAEAAEHQGQQAKEQAAATAAAAKSEAAAPLTALILYINVRIEIVEAHGR